jgi:hypothetical protein
MDGGAVMRQDLILRTIDKFASTLAHVEELKKDGQWDELIKYLGKKLDQLLRIGPDEFRKLTETGLVAQLIKNEPTTTWVPYKKIYLIALLKELGDYATFRDPPRGGRGWYFKALHLLLDAFPRDEMQNECLKLAPRVEVLLNALEVSTLPSRTRMLLIRHYEQTGELMRAKQECVLVLEKVHNNLKLINFCIAFTERISHENDQTLAASGVTRFELNALLADLKAKKDELARKGGTSGGE